VAENAIQTLFELGPSPACAEHGCPSLWAGWRELVAEVGSCDVCGEVLWICLRGFDETPDSLGDSNPYRPRTASSEDACEHGADFGSRSS
jgi:hypothetical protein